jgi:biotin carboxyl carrier protein
MRMRVLASLLVTVIVAALAVAASGAPKQAIEVRATLRGEVLGDDLASPGDEVREGAPLVYVKTQTGRGVAARAPADGRVAEVLVRPGTVIRELGTVVARLEPK